MSGPFATARRRSEPIAIIGLGLRLPGAESLDEFWEHLAAGRSLITEVSPRRWDPGALRGAPSKGNKTSSIWGGFIDDADCFDAGFFNISPREASWMDPQQRFALELAWKAIEDAGIRASGLAGSRTGVYIGVCHWDYAELLEKHLAHVDAYTPTGIAFSIIANRVSHFFDFRGPSIANDTACAASMTSVYEACRALEAGECDLALAGGVNLCWSPNHFVAFSKSGMLSKDGRSKAFDGRADGYVRGEGGAMLLLKPLGRARADGDPIHAVIRGIGTNHGGRTNSLTVTNPKAQAELIAEVYRGAGVTPDTVSYIEAHGTGTPLGDPIEIAGLKEAFRTLAAETGTSLLPESCGVGSVKTNIGHLEGAAGVAGIAKVIAAMRHEMLPANVDFVELNSLIDLVATPFRIQGNATPWPRIECRPRRAGVSAFGFGGSNAHVLLEDDCEAPVMAHRDAPDCRQTLVVPLSAKNEDRLRAYGADLLRFLDRAATDGRLRDLAYTLQVGRDAMPSRIAFVVEDRGTLRSAVQAFLAGEPHPSICLPGALPEHQAAPEPWPTAAQWVGGGDVDWVRLHDAADVRRIRAPTYPFGRERHWIDESLGGKDTDPVPHPLLHRNISGFGNQSYLSRFKGSEFFWADHHVNGAQVLPGTVCLEMARAAFTQAAAFGSSSSSSLRLHDLAWTRPIRAGIAPVPIEIRLSAEGPDNASFTLGSPDPDPVIYAKGKIGRLTGFTAPASHDVAALRERAAVTIEADQCYERLRASGVVHGSSFRAITQLHRGSDFVLANLKLPRLLQATLGGLPLHPIMLDAAIQAWVGLVDDEPTGAAVPFACREVLVHGPCDVLMWALVRMAEATRSGSGVVTLDIDLCDQEGRVRVAFHELVLRTVAAPVEQDASAAVDSGAVTSDGLLPVVFAEGQWQACPNRPDRASGDWDTIVLLAGSSPEAAAAVAAKTGLAVSALASPDDGGPAATAWFRALHARLSGLIRAKPKRLQQILVVSHHFGPHAAPMVALLKTARAEHPKIFGAVVCLEGPTEVDRLVRVVAAEQTRSDRFCELRYTTDDSRMAWRPVAAEPPTPANSPVVTTEGVYWITGGAGGLGVIFAQALAAQGATKIVLSGRRAALAAPVEDSVERLRTSGIDVRYVRCDVADPADVAGLVDWIEQRVGRLKGVIHCAGVLDDGYIFGSDPERIDPVFAPKVAGTLNIDAATRGLALDFLLLCSSVAAVFGNPGQAVYAGANAFMDAFAEHRAALVARGERRGTTLAVAWPLWAEGGMTVDAPFKTELHKRFGTMPLPTNAGLLALRRMLGARCSGRWTILHGDTARITGLLRDFGGGTPLAAPVAMRDEPSDQDLAVRTIAFLKDLTAEAMQIEPALIKANRPLAEYGLDSIVIVELTGRLEQVLGPISKTMFFEHVDLAGVVGYLIEEHREPLVSALAADPPRSVSAAKASQVGGEAFRSADPPPEEVRKAETAIGDRPAIHRDGAGDRHDIAIVGLSLRVAKAADRHAFWEMLASGLHAFEPVPALRWNHEALLHPERDVLGKTVVRTGAFLDGVDEFDPRYFRISQYEAELMSPEVRLLLQASVEAFEDAGYSREYLQRRFAGDVAVIVGSMTNEYDLFGFQNMLMRGALASGSYTGTMPNMISYFYGFTGPSYFLDTMCSASSTCVHEAVHMLRAGRCEMALAGGVSLLLHPQKLIATSQEHFTTKTAEVIRGYGLGADGTILGEGVGALVLKTLTDAERDGDHIYGVIKGSGISNAGVRNGFTVPSPLQQAVAIERALDDGGIDPRTIGYIEGHGSGTALGDPIEIKALTLAFRRYTQDVQFCPIGTAKSNIAHLLGASGLAGIVKVLVQLEHQQLVPSLHAEPLNPNIPFPTTPFYVQRELGPWPRLRDQTGCELPRRAGITSIGAGGMNSHIIIEEHVPREPARAASPSGDAEVMVFSAVSEASLVTWLTRLRDHLLDHPDLPMVDLAYTLQVGRNELPCRLACVCSSVADLVRMLSQFAAAPGASAGALYTKSILDKEPCPDAMQVAADTKQRILDRVAAYWVDGTSIDWDEMHAGRRRRRVSLPAYPFERVRCWYPEYADAPSVVRPIGARSKLHPFIGVNRSSLDGLHYTTQIHLNELLDYVYTENKVQSVLPTAIIEIAAASAQVAGLAGPIGLRNLKVRRAVTWRDVAELTCRVERTVSAADSLRITISAVDAAGVSQPYAEARAVAADFAPSARPAALDLLRRQAVRVLDHVSIYDSLGRGGLRFKPYLEVLEQAFVQSDGSILCQVRSSLPQQDLFKQNVQLPASLLGAAFQALVLERQDAATLCVAAVEAVELTRGEAIHVLTRPRDRADLFDVLFLDEAGATVAAFHGVSLRSAADLASGVESTPARREAEAAATVPPRQTADDPSRARLRVALQGIAGNLLKFSPDSLSPRASFYDLGFDSVSLTHFAAAIGDTYGTNLSPAIFFEHENIDALCGHLIERHGIELDRPGDSVAMQPGPTDLPVPGAVGAAIPTAGAASQASPSAIDRKIAIIGLAARLPGSDSAEAFIENLQAGRDLISDFPADRYGAAYWARIQSAGFVKRGGFLRDIDRFDAAFFKTTPVEAERMDPQQRLMLETVWRALENAGYRPDELPANTGVFVGVTGHDYANLLQAHDVAYDGFAATGNSLAMVSNRISYHLDVHGPSEAVDTACSSSLVALLRAADAIVAGACDAAVVGGVNLTLSLEGFEGPYQAGMLSPDGRCKTFSRTADGYVRGEGVVAVLLKPLRQAERDGDAICGVLIGGAENHGGRAGSLTAPNAKAQAELVMRAMEGIDPASIGYIETHGTGTSLGDPVEINGLRRAYGALMGGAASTTPFVGLGTAKSNIGHLEAAAGLAGVVKVLMAMRRGEIPASLHCEDVNPHIELEDSPFYLVRQRSAWPRRRDAAGQELPRRAGVSSFGFGGSNAHIVLEEYPSDRAVPRRRPLPARTFADTRYWIPGVRSAQATSRATPWSDVVLLVPSWVESAGPDASASGLGARIVVACETGVPDGSSLASLGRMVKIDPVPGDISMRYRWAAGVLLDILQREMRSARTEAVLVQLVVPLGDERELFEGLGAMIDSAQAECPRIIGQVIGLPSSLPPDVVARILADEARDPSGRRVRHRGGRRVVRVWSELPSPQGATPPEGPRWRDGGVYLIAGGMGGLGRLLARDIAMRTASAVLVLVGSSPLDAERAAFLDELRAMGARPHYRQADVASADDIVATVRATVDRHGTIHGVFHCAGIVRDAYVLNKTHADLDAVLAPKVTGATVLAEACRGHALDFLVLFSSLAGAVGNAGQADYAAANGFLDALAARHGAPMVAIDWPLWRHGGMRVDAETEAAFFKQMGQRPLSTENGLSALGAVLASGARQVAVVEGKPEAVREFFAQASRRSGIGTGRGHTRATRAVRADDDLEALIERSTEALRRVFARISGVPAERIETFASLDEYGIDSLMVSRMNRELGGVFGTISKTLLFEHRSLDGLARHLVQCHGQQCRGWIDAGNERPAIALPAAPKAIRRQSTVASSSATAPAGIEPIAIIGLSGRYPGASDLDHFWANLVAGKDLIREVPAERWGLDGFFHPDPTEAVSNGMSYSKWGGFVDGFADFDPLFFKISPRDAAAMDPQERLFLMAAWTACEDAGYTRQRLADRHGSRVGVFVGITKTGFALHGPFRAAGGAIVRPVTSFSGAANRVSHVLDLHGPSMPVDTMCSSSLTAIHEACEHLRSGACELALAGGVNLYLHPSTYVELSAARMLSPDGRCRSFGEGGNGFVPGEGVGCVLLKPLSRALRDGDRIHALIRSSAVNHGGQTNGFTVPNPSAQRDLIRTALDRAGLDARSITCIEAHGTGTELGDPIEVTGLTQAFRADTSDTAFCALGSVKSSVGHLEAAAGIAGLTKVVLQMKHRVLAPTLHAAQVNPNINLAGTPFVLAREPVAWNTPRLIAGVSSFGAGGANAHVVLEAWPSPGFADTSASRTKPSGAPRTAATPGEIFPVLFSARDPDRLAAYATRLLAFIEAPGAAAPSDIASMDAKREDVAALIVAKIADLLDVAPEQIDLDEPFDAIGIVPTHRIGLQSWAEAAFEIELEPATLQRLGSIREFAAALAPVVAAAAADRSRRGASGAADEAFELADLAYTLQVGREPMDARLAVEAVSLDLLANALRAYLDGRYDHPGLHVGRVQPHRDVMSALAGNDVDVRALTTRWMERSSFGRLLGLWVKGWPVDWADLPRATQPRIVTLPTYPFAQERYWVPGAGAQEDQDVIAPIIEDDSADSDALWREVEALEQALAPLVGAIVASVPRAGIAQQFERWRQALDDLLDRFTLRPDTPAAAWAQWEDFKGRATAGGGPSAQVVLAETMLRALPDIVTGVQEPTGVMFPAGGLHLVDGVYKQNAVAARFNGVVAAAAVAAVRRRLSEEPGAELRILEIGAGTGGTSEAVFRALAPYRSSIAEYRYTDLSRAFLIRAERQYRATAPYLVTALLDVEKPLAGQDIVSGHYDLVIAANVLHATADIRSTLAVVRATMAPGGLLLINETSKASLFTHVTFGLLAGWWRFVDADARIPGTPSLTSSSWRAALEHTGFRWIAGSAQSDQRLGQQVIAAAAELRVAEPQPVRSSPVRDAVRHATGEAGGDLQGVLRQAVATTLNIAPAAVDIDKPFADYGLDSILGAELVVRIRDALGIEIEQTRLFDFSTVARLEAFVAERFPDAARALVGRAVAEGHEPASRQAAATPSGSVAESPAPASPAPRRHAANTAREREPIAIVGMSGRFAKSSNVDDLWAHLIAGHDLVEPVTRFDLDSVYKNAEPGSYGRHGSFIDGIDRFDSVFFGISGLEARFMDPQQRLFLEEAWKTLEHAGHAGADIEGRRCGVFVGCSSGDYQELFETQPPGQAFWGNTSSLIPARIAYCLDLKGPAIAVDTACSSSLVALHLACQSLWNGESELALAGGVFVQCTDRFYRYANQARMLSPSGRCAAFGEGADGIVPGEAVAAVLLRPLSDALADGDTIHGTIVATGINQDGATNGITAPSALSQERLVRTVYTDFVIAPDDIGMMEAHGTGTVLGDPIEHEALARAFGAFTDRRGFCALGSIKSNIGHATTAAGMTSLMKVLLALRHRTIPPTLHVGGGNPAIRLSDSPFYINREAQAWRVGDGKTRRAAISSFGFSGTNAHVVIEAAIGRPRVPVTAPAYLCVLSARSKQQLRLQAKSLLAHLSDRPGLDCGDVAYTLLVGRRHHHSRLATVARDTNDLAVRLGAWLAGAPAADVFIGEIVDEDRPDQAARTATGDGLIHGLRDDLARVPAERQGREAYAATLRKLAQAFVAGDALRFDAIFDPATRHRVPLPTYPFAPIRHWIDTPAAAQSVSPAVRVATTSDSSSRSTVMVRLADVASMAARRPSAAGTMPKVSLVPLAIRSIAATSVLLRLPDVDGVRRLELVSPWNSATEEAMVRELAFAGGDEGVRAVLMSSRSGWISARQRACGAAQAAVACAVPVVAAVNGSADGDALVLALHCDFVVLAEEGRYAATANLPPEGLELLSLRLGQALDMVSAGRARVGTELRAEGLAIVPAAEVEIEALNLARSIAQAPRQTLRELKRHLRQDRLPGRVGPMPGNLLGAQAECAPPGEPVPPAGPGRPLALASDVIALEVFADGVALVRMTERRHKNSFTDAFMAGMTEAFDQIDRSPDINVVVLTGYQGYFACGGTLEGLESLQRGETSFTDQKIYSLPLACRVPVIAAMQGHAIGAGWSLGMFCDLAVFSADSVYHNNYLRLGFAPGAGASLVAPDRLGDDLGRETLFSAREYKGRDLAQRAAHLIVVPAGDVLPLAMTMARRLARLPRRELIDAKTQSSSHLSERLDATFARELAMHQATLVGNDEAAERIRLAFGARPGIVEATSETTSQSINESTRRREQVRQEVVATLAEELMIDAGEVRDACGFIDIGLDSILAVTWIRRLNERFRIGLPATAVYAHPTVGGLVDRIVALVADAPAAIELPRPAPAPSPAAEPRVAAATEPQPAGIAREASRARRTYSEQDAIAVIGAAGRFPKARDLDAFWENIRAGRDCISIVPPERWDVAKHYDPDPLKPEKSYCKWMGVVDEVDQFDPQFFNITPREAELMDPQQRLFLQCAWHAIEDAGIDPVRLAGAQCGVFVGSGPSGYADLIDERNAYSLLGSAGSILAARIAYLLDLRGPAVSLDTACSSSLVAISEACDSLLLGNSDLALAGGASVLIGPSMFIDTSKVGMLSPDGRCFTFDHRANGFVPGEGVGVMLLKRLADAERDGDPVRAVIRAWGVNQDGKTNGITAPNPQAQTRLLRGVHERFGIDCATIELVEAHGTGTALGDPIEIEGLTDAFAGCDPRRSACALGSVKSNVGHLLAAAGIAGAMKAVLALERGETPPTINFERQNDHISLDGTPFYINTALKDWQRRGTNPRRAAVSAFGFSGTNAHLVLEEYRQPARSGSTGAGPWLFPLSARSPEQLVDYAAALAKFVASRPDIDPVDLAATFQSGRTPLAHRLAFLFRDRGEFLATLDAVAAGRAANGVYRTGPMRGGVDGSGGTDQTLDALARRWAHGAEVSWTVGSTSGRRVRAPGYPFARQRCWIDPATADVPVSNAPVVAATPRAVRAQHTPHPLIDRAVAGPEGDAFTATFRGDARDLSDLVAGDECPLVGLFLPEMARAAGQLATQRSVQGLKHLVWGKPASINGGARELSVVLRSDAQGFLYVVVVDGNQADPCHVGALILNEENVAWPDPLATEELRLAGEDVTEAWLRFAEADRPQRSQASTRQAADSAVRQVYRNRGEVLAQLRFPAHAAAGRAMSISPLHLHALWRLMAFRGAGGREAEPRYPYALERLLQAGPAPDELVVRLCWPEEGDRGPATAIFYDMNGVPRLMLEGLVTRRLDELPDLALVGT